MWDLRHIRLCKKLPISPRPAPLTGSLRSHPPRIPDSLWEMGMDTSLPYKLSRAFRGLVLVNWPPDWSWRWITARPPPALPGALPICPTPSTHPSTSEISPTLQLCPSSFTARDPCFLHRLPWSCASPIGQHLDGDSLLRSGLSSYWSPH